MKESSLRAPFLKVQLAGCVEGEAVHDGAGGGADDPAGGDGEGDADDAACSGKDGEDEGRRGAPQSGALEGEEETRA